MKNARRIAAGLALAAAIAGCGGGGSAPAGTASQGIASDLQTLLDNKAPTVEHVGECVHQNGNQYICAVTPAGGKQMFVSVTDDGHYIYEQGIAG